MGQSRPIPEKEMDTTDEDSGDCGIKQSVVLKRRAQTDIREMTQGGRDSLLAVLGIKIG